MPPKAKAKPKAISSKLKINDLVKVSNGKERFWVKIKKITDKYISGEVVNHLVDVDKKYDYGDVIKFEKNKIIDIHH